MSEWRVRIASRNATPASVLIDFDSGTRKFVTVLESFDDETLQLSATRMGETRTLAGMFQKPLEHLSEHAAQIRAGLAEHRDQVTQVSGSLQ